MTKLIVSGDIHIHNFPHHNIEPNFRLNQFISLANRLNGIGQENNADVFVIAGDLVHKALLTPDVAYTVQKFIETLLDGYKQIHYILGNHDIYSKSLSKSDRKFHSIIPLILDKYGDRVVYVDQKVLKFPNGTTIGYRNWLPNQDFSFIEDKVDVLVGHVTLHEKFGQSYDNSKYRLGIFGDIHNRSNIDHSYTTNVPIPHHISDDQDGSVILIDTEKLKDCKDEYIIDAFNKGIIQRINTESDSFKHLRIYYSDKVPEKHLSHKYLVTYETAKVENTKNIKITSSTLSIHELIDDTISQNGLVDIYKKVSANVPNSVELLSLDFDLKSVSISNFRSIDSYESDLDTGIMLLSGRNGSGKSSLIKAIKYGLVGQSRDFDKLIKNGQSDMEVSITISYKSSTYNITRGVSGKKQYLSVYIDGVELETSTISQKEKSLREKLPFLDYVYLYIKHEDDPPLLHSLNYDTRIKIISKLLGLDIISFHYEEAVSQRKEISNTIQSLMSKKDALLSILEEKKDKVSKFDKDEIENKLSKVLNYISQLRDKLDSIKEKRKLGYNQQSILNEIGKTESVIQSLVIENIPKPPDISISEIDSNIKQLKTKLKDGESFLLELESAYNSTVKEIGNVYNQLQSIEKVCPTCGSELDKNKIEPIEQSMKDRIKELEELKEEQANKIAKFKTKFSSIKKKIEDAIDKLEKDRSKSDENVWKRYLQNEEVKNKKVRLEEKLDSLKLQLSELGELINIAELDSEYDELSSSINKMIENKSKIEAILSIFSDIEDCENKISDIDKKLPDLERVIDKYSTYIDVFKSNGVLIKEVLGKLSVLLSTPEMKVITFKEMKNGNMKQELSIEYKVGDKFIPYNQLSGGQKTLADLMFLTRLLDLGSGCKFMILDEYLKHLDSDNLEVAIKIIKDSGIENVIVVTQLPELPYIDSIVNVDFDEDTLTSTYH